MRLLDRYIRNAVISSTALVILVLVGIESFLELVAQLHYIGHGHYGVLKVFMVVPLQLPSNIYQLFPIAGFIGCLIGLGRLASSSQLIVMRASGVSIARIGWAVLKAAILMIIVVTFVGEVIAPAMQSKSVQIKQQALGSNMGLKKLHGVWLHQGTQFISVSVVQTENHIDGITIYRFAKNQTVKSIIWSSFALREKGVWYLKNGSETTFSAAKIRVKKFKSMVMPAVFNPRLLAQSKKEADQDSALEIFHNIMYREKTGLVTSQYQLAFWQRILQPITTVVMICLGIPFIFGSLRSASMGTRVLSGIVVGFCFYMMNAFFGPISLVYQFPPIWAAVLPTFVFIALYFVLVRRVY